MKYDSQWHVYFYSNINLTYFGSCQLCMQFLQSVLTIPRYLHEFPNLLHNLDIFTALKR